MYGLTVRRLAMSNSIIYIRRGSHLDDTMRTQSKGKLEWIMRKKHYKLKNVPARVFYSFLSFLAFPTWLFATTYHNTHPSIIQRQYFFILHKHTYLSTFSFENELSICASILDIGQSGCSSISKTKFCYRQHYENVSWVSK